MKKGNLLLIIITLIIIMIVCIFSLLINLRKQNVKPPAVETYKGEQLAEVTDRNNYYMSSSALS